MRKLSSLTHVLALLMFLFTGIGLATAQPIAGIAASDSSGCAPITISFTDVSTPGGLTITGWTWNFGDGTTSMQQNPVHTYTTDGYYNVSLTISLSNGSTSTAWLWLDLAGPEIWWIGPSGAICGPGPVNYQAFVDSSNFGATYEWFVNGVAAGSGGGQFPTLNFPTAGTYDVKLRVTDLDGCQDSLTQAIVIPAALSTGLTTTGASCGANDGSASVAPAGGTPPYFAQWSNGMNGNSVSGLGPGLYTVTIFDTVGCSVTDTFFINQSGLNISATLTNPSCDNDQNGAIDLTVSGGAGGYTFNWSNGATTEDLSGLGSGIYIVTVSDGTCTTADTFELDASVLSLVTSTTTTDCWGGNVGTATVAVTGGVQPYTYAWSNGGTTAMVSGLAQGGYSVTVTDANGCTDHELAFVSYDDTCVITLSGKVYYDANSNCTFDPGEIGFGGWITLSNGTSVFADVNGDYSIDVFPGDYVVGYNIGYFPNMTLVCPNTGLYQLTNVQTDQTGLDFAFVGDSVNRDLRISLYQGAPRPGFNHTYYYYVYNNGGVPVSPVVTLTMDPLADFITANPAPSVYNPTTNTVSFVGTPMLPGTYYWGTVTAYLDPTVPLGTPMVSYAQVDPIAGDIYPVNNVDTVYRTVVGSFDPNDKLVTPQGEGPAGHIAPDEQEMRYTIRFQNTGTDTAFFVVIRDTIDADLDVMTFKPTTWSHPYELTIEEDNILVFSFPNILLPDSNTNEAASHGHVGYTMLHNGTLDPGTEITNRAAIYFDFNAPIITNTVLNTIFVSTGLKDQPWAGNLKLYPNPTQDRCVIEDEGLVLQRVELYDMRGARLSTTLAREAHRIEMSTQSLPEGSYLLRIFTDQGPVVRRLVRTR